jgi:hypothetical protein
MLYLLSQATALKMLGIIFNIIVALFAIAASKSQYVSEPRLLQTEDEVEKLQRDVRLLEERMRATQFWLMILATLSILLAVVFALYLTRRRDSGLTPATSGDLGSHNEMESDGSEDRDPVPLLFRETEEERRAKRLNYGARVRRYSAG